MKLPPQQIYNREYWRLNKEWITLMRQTELKEEIADYQLIYRKKNLKAYKKYNKAYRKKYYQTNGR